MTELGDTHQKRVHKNVLAAYAGMVEAMYMKPSEIAVRHIDSAKARQEPPTMCPENPIL